VISMGPLDVRSSLAENEDMRGGWKSESESGIRLDPTNKGAPCQPLAGVHGSHPFEYARLKYSHSTPQVCFHHRRMGGQGTTGRC
jgi:hypothetical protein